MFRLIAARDDDDRRLDRILRKHLPDMPLSGLHRLLRKGKIRVDGAAALPGSRIRAGQLIEIPESAIPGAENHRGNQGAGNTTIENPERKVSLSSCPNIIYEDQGLLILNKPAGIPVHGPGSLDEQVRFYLEPALPPSLSFRPGPLHRLDKPTSGIIVFSVSLKGARYFSALLRERKIQKQYLAIVDGTIEGEETWIDDLVRKKGEPGEKKQQAITRIRALAAARNHTLILAEIETGRTHQIRAQSSLHGHPLSGDLKYGGKDFSGSGNFFLHAWKLELDDPAFPARAFEAPLPSGFRMSILQLFGEETLKKNNL